MSHEPVHLGHAGPYHLQYKHPCEGALRVLQSSTWSSSTKVSCVV